jgi:hypothetical protein
MAVRGGQFSARGGRTLRRKAKERTNHAIGSGVNLSGAGKLGKELRHGATERRHTGGAGVRAR